MNKGPECFQCGKPSYWFYQEDPYNDGKPFYYCEECMTKEWTDVDDNHDPSDELVEVAKKLLIDAGHGLRKEYEKS